MAKYVVRYGAMRTIGIFSCRGKDQEFRRSDRVVTRTRRGLEIGTVLCEATDEPIPGIETGDEGDIIRRLTANDANEWAHIESQAGAEFKICQQTVRELDLPMELVDLEHIFGGERVVIYYLSENRVDFRDLVKQLAREFQTRIEMRQIGVRDEAKLLADYGDCGQPVCCNTHLTKMPPVSMKMAKVQKATLDPTKISGRCGRLKCCLRYEYDTYAEILDRLPPIGSQIVSRSGPGKVVGQDILAEQLLVEMEDHRRVLVPAADILTVIRDKGNVRTKKGKSDEISEDE
jgi:cell fate regulator YaaT (PSP1 superfamily)